MALAYNGPMTHHPDPYETPSLASSTAPTLADIESLAHGEFAHLPRHFRAMCDGLVIQVDDFPADEVLDAMGLDSAFDILGLFQGVGLPHQSISDPAPMPNMIWLYRRPILDAWAENDDPLGAIVRHVLIHEIGHHFGLSDADMEAIEQAATPPGEADEPLPPPTQSR